MIDHSIILQPTILQAIATSLQQINDQIINHHQNHHMIPHHPLHPHLKNE